MKYFRLFLVLIIIVLFTLTLSSQTYEHFSAFSGVNTAKSKVTQLGYTDDKLICIGAFAYISGNPHTSNTAVDGNTQNWLYLFATNSDSKLVIISVTKQNGVLSSEFLSESDSKQDIEMGFDSFSMVDFNELPQNLVNSDSIYIEYGQNILKKINVDIPCIIHRFVLLSVKNHHLSIDEKFINEDYIWDITMSCHDYEPFGQSGWERYWLSAVSGKTIAWVASTGVNDNNLSNSLFQVSPNPATDFIDLNIINGASPIASEVQIFNMLGIEMMSVGTGLDLSTQRIDVSHLTAGVYFIKIGDKVEKFVKM